MSLYTKYRPSNFDNLIGQDFINNTLRKAIENNKTVSSYLLCWPRGTGKTTTARLIAKWVNCLATSNGNPCGVCENCEAFQEERLIDIIEIDAASHTWVDNIREIIERAQFQPTKAKYKVYIIDEVHMLTKWAFNALLKTLEEPPKHVKFILATTETHKVPDTILSRCQRYDFKSISESDIQKRLSYIAEQEWVTYDKESLEYIALVSKWAMRNAISLFEQMIEDEEISYPKLVSKLWLTDSDTITWVYNKLLDWDVEVLETIHTLTKDGENLNVFFWEILSHAKEEVLQNLKSDDISKRIYMLDVLNSWLSSLKYSYDPEVTVMTILSKILGIYKIITPVLERKISVASSPDKENWGVDNETVKARSVEPVAEKIPEIKLDNIKLQDATDIFWGAPEKQEKKSTEKAQFDNFSKDAFLDALKSIGTKWALIISLKQARNFSMHENHLEIVLQNNFTLKAMNTWENVLQLIKGLEKMWVEWKTVKLT